MKREFAILALVALLALGGCTSVDFVIPEPVQKEENKTPSEPNDEPEEPTETPEDPTDEPEEPSENPTNPDTPITPDTPTDEPQEPTYSAKAKWVASVEELEKLSIVAGDTIVWRSGTYANVDINFSATGVASKPIVLTGEKGGEVIFTGSSQLKVSGKYVEVRNLWWKDPSKTPITIASGSSHVVVSECAITGYGTAESTKDYKWVSLYGSDHTIRNCYFADKRNMGALLVVWMESGVVPRNTIEGNYFLRPHSISDGTNGQETIRIGTSDYSLSRAECVVRGNVFHACNAETEIISNKSCGNLYEGNLFRASAGTLTLRHGNDCIVRGNWFFGDKKSNTGGVRVIGEGHRVENNYLENLRGSGYKTAICLVRGEENAALSGYAQVKGAIVRGNTIVGCRYSMHLNYGKDSMTMPVIESTIADNTIYCTSSGDYAVYLYTTPAPDIAWSGNKVYGGTQKGVSLATLSAAPSIGSVTTAVAKVESECGPKWKSVIK